MNLRCVFYLFPLLVGFESATGVAESFPRPGEWPAHRRDGTQQARSPARGHLSQPHLVWKQFVGVLESWLVVEPATGARSFELPHIEINPTLDPLASSEWGLANPSSGSLNAVVADLLPEFAGAETFEFESSFNKPTINGRWQECVGRCFVSRDGQRTQLWETGPIPNLFQALPLAGDFDNDGQPDLAILPWREMLLLDARTGRVKDRCRFTEGRSYGFFGARDLDGDGRAEFVVQSDFSKHVEVLGFREGKLTLLWQRVIELDISNPQKILRVGPNPVADVDGDGRKEVLVNVFNDTGDQRWHLTVYDGVTGAVRADLPDEFYEAAADLNGDASEELLTTAAKGGGLPNFGTIRARSLKTGKVSTLWERHDAGWSFWEPPIPAQTQSGATLGRRTVLCRDVGGTSVGVVRVQGAGSRGNPELQRVRWGKSGFESDLQIAGSTVEGCAIDSTGRLLVRAHHPPEQTAKLKLNGCRIDLVSSKRRGGEPASVIAVLPDRSKRPILAAQGFGEEVILFEPPRSQVETLINTPASRTVRAGSTRSSSALRTSQGVLRGSHPSHLFRRLSGRGQSTLWPQTLGPVAADLHGNGERQILLATAAPDGCARLRAVDLRGRELWRRDFPTIPGTPPVWNTGGLILWQTGHFTDPRRHDVLLTKRRSMMHSDETCLLSGKDGTVLWQRDRQKSDRGVGGAPFAIADFDGNGLDDLCQLYPSLFCLMAGRTGSDLIARDALWDEVPAKPVYWGVPFAIVPPATGKTAVFFGGRSMTGLVQSNGKLSWWDALDNAALGDHAFGDFDGDGGLEAIGLGYANEFRCYDIATGQVKWRLPASPGVPSTGCASADLDGDGREEAVFVIGQKMICIGSERDSGKGVRKWEVELPTRCGPPSLAVLDPKTGLSIVLLGADGVVYCFQ